MAKERKRPILSAPSTAPSTASVSRPKKDASTRTSIACGACKRRKSRCVGRPPPCQMCRTSDTMCIIDATSDQRRKIAAKQLAEQAEVQRELLISILRCMRYGQQNDIQELLRSVRDMAPGKVIVDLIQQFSSGLHSGQKSSHTGLDELLDAYTTVLRDRNSQDTADFRSRRESSESTIASATQIKTEVEAFDRTTTSDISLCRSPRQSLRQTYERWAQYFQLQQPTQQLSPSAHARFGLPTLTLNPLPGGDVNSGIVMPNISMSPGLAGQPLFFSNFDERALWHPVLRIVPSSGGVSSVSTSTGNTDVGVRQNQAPDSSASQNGDQTYVEILRSFPSSAISPQSPRTAHDQYKTVLELSRFAIHYVQPLNRHENSPLSRVITDYREAGRKFIADGNSPIEVLGKDDIAVDLLFRERKKSDESTVPDWASEIWRSFSDWPLLVRLSNVLFYTHLMRWTLIPTSEQYALLPSILKPTQSQRLIPHHPAIDFIPFPQLRDGLIRNFRDWMTAFPAAGIDIAWEDPMESAVYRDQVTGQMMVTQAFERFVVEPENWKIGRSVLGLFPEFEGTGIVLVEGR